MSLAEIDRDSQWCGQAGVAAFLETDTVSLEVRPGRDGQGRAGGFVDCYRARER